LVVSIFLKNSTNSPIPMFQNYFYPNFLMKRFKPTKTNGNSLIHHKLVFEIFRSYSNQFSGFLENPIQMFQINSIVTSNEHQEMNFKTQLLLIFGN